MHDINFFSVFNIKKIELLYKTSYACRIYLYEKFKNEKDIIIFQLLLGSDWMKEVNTLMNHFIFKMKYSNRLFTCKRYKGGEIKTAEILSVTRRIKNYVTNEKRKKFRN